MANKASKSEEQPGVSFDTKLRPSQTRARHTFEMILAVAGELLAEVGFERLSTNLVCERAGLTPPALYRYFPNKYAILSELGRRLMLAQDRVVFDWINAGGLEAETLEEAIAKYERVNLEVNRITKEIPGGVWILRALRAVPMLQDIRTGSSDLVARHAADYVMKRHPKLNREDVYAATRVITELTYAASEMVLEQPEVDEALVTREVCRMMALYYAHITAPPAAPAKRARGRKAKSPVKRVGKAKPRKTS
ncbi:MAG: TetR family transcriptional regulator [Alphaproteobacteria bacterium]|nr:MAG: TetR family transcriptional regulator [Alphaproteobacteria bacterium]